MKSVSWLNIFSDQISSCVCLSVRVVKLNEREGWGSCETKTTATVKFEGRKIFKEDKVTTNSRNHHEKIWLFNGNLLFKSALNWNNIHTANERRTRIQSHILIIRRESFKRASCASRTENRTKANNGNLLRYKLSILRGRKWKQRCENVRQEGEGRARWFTLNCFGITRVRYTFYHHYHCLRYRQTLKLCRFRLSVGFSLVQQCIWL